MTRIPRASRRRPRPGFTIPELLVAAAMCIIIMAILATCFQAGIDTLRQLKSQGDMTDQLRAAEIVIKRDLQAKRFPTQDDRENLGVRLSDMRYDLLVPDPTGTILVKDPSLTSYTYTIGPPRGGFMRIKSSEPNTGYGSFSEGFDPDGMESTGAIDHYLHFTSILTGGIDQNVFTA